MHTRPDAQDSPDAALALRGGLPDQHAAWAFLRWYADTWLGRPLRPEDGCPEEELASTGRELELELPAALRAGYRLLGRRTDLTSAQDPLLPPSGLFTSEATDTADRVLVFRVENQSAAAWGIPLDRLSEADPPVLVESRDGWVPFLERVSLAWVELVLIESLLADGAHADSCELPAAHFPALFRHVHRLPLPDHPMWTGPDESPLRWYAAPGLLVRHDGGEDLCWLHVHARTAEELTAFREAYPADWVC
ncbi:SMI1/KNR4 family protein [Kitasatospora sp. NPDC051984]|uniref:SMI1/KNR4 family protein n=1 Tax=Kitasatospora sp. NPDC051984 TaxID=3364059 RepID=UPI0037C607F7